MLTEFSPKLLNFIYALSKIDIYKSSIDIAESIRLAHGHSVTPKTIRNWFQYLRRPYRYGKYHVEERLSYFPGAFKNKLGLKLVSVFYEEPSERIVDLFPLRDYVGWLYDPQSNKPVLIVEYAIPEDHHEDFLGIVNQVKERGLCTDLSIYPTEPSHRMIAPLHEVIDTNGVFHPEKCNPIEIRNQIEGLLAFLQSDKSTEISPAIRRNPLIIPVLAALEYEHKSSPEVWSAIKYKLKDSVWDYVGRFRKKTDGVGVKKVQAIIPNLKGLGLLNQMRVVYFPLEIGRNMWIYTVFNFKNKGELIRMAEIMLVNSIYCNLFPLGGYNAMMVTLVNGESLQNLFNPLSDADVEKFYFFDYFKSMNLVTTTRHVRFDYANLFNPRTCRWAYNHDEMLSELVMLS